MFRPGLFHWWLLLCLAFLTSATGREVSRTPPAEFGLLEKYLTPLAEAQALPEAPRDAKEEAAVEMLVSEVITVVKESGESVRVRHIVRKALNETGVKALGEFSTEFDADRTRSHLILARTILPDGAVVDVEDKAMFLKEDPGEGSFHTGSRTLNVVFPRVSVGAVTEVIVVQEEFLPTVPGEFLYSHTWGFRGPVRRQRCVMLLPETMEPRLRAQWLGATKLDPLRTSLADGMVGLEWKSDSLAPAWTELKAPPAYQVGPQLRMSTLESWEKVGKWFSGLLRAASEETPSIRETAVEWAGGATTLRAIAENLYRKVADEIRYTGLEFGEGAYRPRNTDQVLATRYGDCKDKANLLSVLLREHGIKSRVALLDSAHAGYIDRTIPSPGRFDHAILHVELDGEGVFCDPTIPYSAFGELAQSTVDRETLLVDVDGGVEWRRTPKQSGGLQEGRFDLVLEPGGGVSGWITLEASGNVASIIAERLSKKERSVALKSLGGLFFLPGAEIIDYEMSAQSPGKLKVSAFVQRNPSPKHDGTSERIYMPVFAFSLGAVGAESSRRTSIYTPRVDSTLSGSYWMPEGWKVADLPPTFERKTPSMELDCRWEEANGALRGEVRTRALENVIPARDHPALWQARADCLEWFKTPILATRAGKAATPARHKAPEAKPDLEHLNEPYDFIAGQAASRTADPLAKSLPKMFTPAGQSALINKRFPLDMNAILSADFASRSVAFERAKAFFPDDVDFQFEAETQILLGEFIRMDIDPKTEEKAQTLISRYEGKIAPEKITMAKVLLVGALAQAEKHDEVVEMGRELLNDPKLTAAPRAGLALNLAMSEAARENSSPKDVLRFSQIVLETPMFPDLGIAAAGAAAFDALARLPEERPDAIANKFDEIVQKHAALSPTLELILAELPVDLLEDRDCDAAEKAFAALETIAARPTFDEDARETFAETKEELDGVKALRSIQARLIDWVKANPWPEDPNGPLEMPATFEACETAIEDEESPHRMLRLYRWILTGYGQPTDLAYLGDAVSEGMGWLGDAKNRPPSELLPLLEQFLDAWGEVPREDGEENRPALTKGELIAHRDGTAAGIDFLRALAMAEGEAEDTRAEARARVGDLLVNEGQYDEALAEWDAILPDTLANESRQVAAIYLCLTQGRKEDAWKRVDKLVAALKQDELLDDDAADQAEQMSGWTGRRAKLERWWDASAKWWPEWEALAASLGMDAGKPAEPTEFISLTPEKYLESLSEENNGEAQEMVVRAMLAARWDPSQAAIAVKVLREHVSKTYPTSKDAVRSLAKKIGPQK
jgi:hypothetical protein